MANYGNDARPPNGTRVRYMASDRPDIPKGICGVITHQDSSNAPYFDFDNGERHRCVYIRDCEPESDNKSPDVDATRYSASDRPKTGTKIVYLGNPEKGEDSYNHSDGSVIQIGETGVVYDQDNSLNPKIKMDTLDTGNGRFRSIDHFGEFKSVIVTDEHPQRFAKSYDIPIGTRVRYIGHSDSDRTTRIQMNDVGVVENKYDSEIFRIQWDKSGTLLAYTDTLEPETLVETRTDTDITYTKISDTDRPPTGTRVRFTGSNTKIRGNGNEISEYVGVNAIGTIHHDGSSQPWVSFDKYLKSYSGRLAIHNSEMEIITMVAKTQAETIVAAVPGARADNLSVIANSLLSLTVREMNSLIRHMKAISDLPLDGVDLSNVLLEAADRLLGIETAVEPEIVVEQSF